MAALSLEMLQDLIGYRFREPKLLLEALTHSSYAQETSNGTRDNEQMEFLGDAILNFVVSVRLADTFPGCGEGKLSRARASLVAAPHLSDVAARIGLGEHLRLGR
jgi:ribonuclease-3